MISLKDNFYQRTTFSDLFSPGNHFHNAQAEEFNDEPFWKIRRIIILQATISWSQGM